jgi:tRNA (adenine22-N1)-methyltransferase
MLEEVFFSDSCFNRDAYNPQNARFEDGKYYPMMKVIQGEDRDYTDGELLYGKQLLQDKNEILKAFLEKEQGTKKLILGKLNQEKGAHIEMRKSELEEELRRIEYALQRYY